MCILVYYSFSENDGFPFPCEASVDSLAPGKVCPNLPTYMFQAWPAFIGCDHLGLSNGRFDTIIRLFDQSVISQSLCSQFFSKLLNCSDPFDRKTFRIL